MKKNVYQAPKCEAYDMRVQGILCGSEIAGGGGHGHARQLEFEEEE